MISFEQLNEDTMKHTAQHRSALKCGKPIKNTKVNYFFLKCESFFFAHFHFQDLLTGLVKSENRLKIENI